MAAALAFQQHVIGAGAAYYVLPKRPSKVAQVEAALADIAPDEMTPKQALELLYKLKALGADEGSVEA